MLSDRPERPSKAEYYLDIALAVAARSTCLAPPLWRRGRGQRRDHRDRLQRRGPRGCQLHRYRCVPPLRARA